jgi:hypothetical protein
MTAAWCAICTKSDQTIAASPSSSGFWHGQSKQDLLDQLCEQLGLPHHRVGVGSSLPSAVFDELVRRFQVRPGSMPEVAEAVVRLANLDWTAGCDSRGSISGGGSTVTREGLEVLVKAVARLRGRGA